MVDSTLSTLTPVVRSPASRILLIIRPGKLLDLLKLELAHEGYEVIVAHDSISSLIKHRDNPQLVVLDGSVANFCVRDLCYRLRCCNEQTAIFVLTPADRTSDRVAALNAGADDCIAVPFVMSEFLARIRAHLRRYRLQNSVLRFKDLCLNTLTREVYRGDRYIRLTAKEFNLLEYLIAHPRQILTRDRIIERVWGYDYEGNSNVIEVYIRYLRLKLEANSCKRLIYTIRGVGYVLRESSL